jgi:molecular chaperone DnaJ
MKYPRSSRHEKYVPRRQAYRGDPRL